MNKETIEFILGVQACLLRALGPDSDKEFRILVDKSEDINACIAITKQVAEINGVRAYVSTNGTESFDVLVKE